MLGFDPRKYHGRRLEEVVKIVDGDVRSALEEAQATYRFCLRQKDLPVRARGYVRMQLWRVEKQLGWHGMYFSQAGQDRYLNEQIFRNRRNGTFVEIGGYDGWTGSNCVFFEKVMNWTGLVVEASPLLVKQIGATRSANVIHAAVSEQDGTSTFLEVTSGLKQMGGLIDHYPDEILRQVREDKRHAESVITVPSTRLDTLLRAHALTKIDYCSIDVEGAERAVLRSVDFDEFDISVLSIENNRPIRESVSYQEIMSPAGYQLVAVIGMDEIWAKEG